MQNLNLVLRLRADGKGFVGEMRQSGEAVKKLGSTGQTTAAQLKGTEQQMRSVNNQTAALKGQVLALAGGFSALATARDITQTLARYQDMRTQITALVGGQQQWIETEQYLISTATEHNKVLTDMAGNYARLASLQEAGLVNQEELRQIFEGMSNAQSQAGASSVQLDQAMYGLSQALASPIVRAEELNQVVEPLPGLLNKMDKAAGLSAGGFRRMMLAGQVSSDFFKTTLIKALADYDGAAARLSSNINAQFAQMENAWQQAVVAFESPVSDSLSPVLGGISKALTLLAENADTVGTLIGVTFAASLGRGAAAVVALTTAKVQAIAADRAKMAAIIAEAQAQERLALSMKATALGAVQSQAAEARLTAARLTLANATNTATVASRAFGSAMALMGGPVGIVMTAAGALAYFAMQADSASVDTRGLKDEVDGLLGRMDKLEESRLSSAIEKQKAHVAQLRGEYNKLAFAPLPGQTLWQQVTESNGEMRARQKEEARETAALVSAINKELIPAEQDLAALEQRLADLRSGKAAPTTPEVGRTELPSPDTTGQQDAAQRLLDSLKKQTSLYGETSEAAKVLYEIENGGLKGVNEQLHPQLIAEAEKLDLLNAQTDALQRQQEAQQQLDNLRRQAALGDDPSQVAQVRYEIDHGDLQGVDAGMQQALLAAAAQLDQRKADQKAVAFEQEVATLAQQNEVLRAMQMGEFEAQRVQAAQAHAERLETLTVQFEELRELYADDQEKQRELEDQYLQGRESLHANQQAKMTEIDKAEEGKRQQLQTQQLQNYGNLFGGMADIAGAFAGEQSGVYQGLFAVSKAFSIAESIMAIQTGIAKAWELGWPAGIGAAATVISQTAGVISTIQGTTFQGQAHDGIDRVPASNEGTWLLKQDEMVLNPTQADSFRWMVSIMEQMVSGVKAASAGAGPAATSVVIRFEGLPDGYSATQELSATDTLLALIKAGDKKAEDNAYNRVAKDLRSKSGAVGKAK